MARTVTYRRRTKTGKVSTVTRRVSGDKPRPRIVDKQTGATYVWITKRVGGGKQTGKYVAVPGMSGRKTRNRKK